LADFGLTAEQVAERFSEAMAQADQRDV